MTPSKQLDTFIDRFRPEVAALARRALAKMRKLTAGALEFVYDNYNALVIAFGPTERASDLILSVALYPRYATLFFAKGVTLPDQEHFVEAPAPPAERAVTAAKRATTK